MWEVPTAYVDTAVKLKGCAAAAVRKMKMDMKKKMKLYSWGGRRGSVKKSINTL